MSFKSPLNQVRGLGSAKGGTEHWWHQRLSSIALIPLGLWLALALARVDLGSHAALVAWIREPMTAILMGLTAACLIYHSHLGVRVVLEDYVGGEGAKVAALALSAFVHVFAAAVALFAILRIALGSG
jgi:succinate dehydrogenase / fumarate reductase membrane anchor subunit